MVNYSSVEEILSSGITNMEVLRNNSKNDSGTDNITGVDWFIYNGNTVSTIYANGNSWIGLGSTTEHLKVNRRDAATYNLYREEGTLFNHYKFLKIRWDGYSYYGSTATSYRITYDVILWDTGDISLHMVNIPTAYNNGIYAFNNTAYVVSTSSPDVTFEKTDDGYEVLNSVIDLLKGYYLLRSNDKYYNIIDGILKQIEIEELTSEAFLTYGSETYPNISLISTLGDFEILYWNEINVDIKWLSIKCMPPTPQVVCYDIQTIPENSIIYGMTSIASDDVLFSISFDESSTWKYYDNGWKTVSSDSEGMNQATIKNITQAQWSEVITSSTFQIRCTLFNKDSYAGFVGIKYV